MNLFQLAEHIRSNEAAIEFLPLEISHFYHVNN